MLVAWSVVFWFVSFLQFISYAYDVFRDLKDGLAGVDEPYLFPCQGLTRAVDDTVLAFASKRKNPAMFQRVLECVRESVLDTPQVKQRPFRGIWANP